MKHQTLNLGSTGQYCGGPPHSSYRLLARSLDSQSRRLGSIPSRSTNNNDIMFEFEDIYIYIKRPLHDRKSHINLGIPCIRIGGRISTEFRGLLAHTLKTTIPKGMGAVYLCHACNVKDCSNPKHMYWGTPTENNADNLLTEKWRRNHLLGVRKRKNKKRKRNH